MHSPGKLLQEENNILRKHLVFRSGEYQQGNISRKYIDKRDKIKLILLPLGFLIIKNSETIIMKVCYQNKSLCICIKYNKFIIVRKCPMVVINILLLFL